MLIRPGPDRNQCREIACDSSLNGKSLPDGVEARDPRRTIAEGAGGSIGLQLASAFIGILHRIDDRGVARLLLQPPAMVTTDGER